MPDVVFQGDRPCQHEPTRLCGKGDDLGVGVLPEVARDVVDGIVVVDPVLVRAAGEVSVSRCFDDVPASSRRQEGAR
jgi:hypothetical protein